MIVVLGLPKDDVLKICFNSLKLKQGYLTLPAKPAHLDHYSLVFCHYLSD